MNVPAERQQDDGRRAGQSDRDYTYLERNCNRNARA